MSSEHAAKRSRSVQWRVTFDQVQTLQKLVEIVEKVLNSLSMRIVKTETGGRLEIDSIDHKKACMVQARIDVMEFNVDSTRGDVDAISICLKSKPLLTCLSSSPAHFSVELMQYMGSTSVFLRSYDNLSNSHVCEAEIKSIVDESETALLDDMDFKFEVQIDLAILRNIVKTASALNSSDIRLQVFEPKKDASSRLTAFRVSAEGGDDATPASTFVSQLEGDCNVIRTEDSVQVDVDLGDMDTSYDEKFSVSYLHSFMKSMERQSLSLKISPTETNSPRMPLVIEYPLGKTDNFIKFVLAPRLD